jgi:hypothetical protein
LRVLAVALLLLPFSSGLRAAAAVINPRLTGPITVDGHVTSDEWAGITPLAYISPRTNQGTLYASSLSNPRTNALLYAGAFGARAGLPEPIPQPAISMMFVDYARTLPFGYGEFVAALSIPVDPVAEMPEPMPRPAFVTLQVRSGFSPDSAPFVYWIDVDGDGGADLTPGDLGISVSAGFEQVAELPEPIPNPPDQPVLVMEMTVPLQISATFSPLYPLGAQGLSGPGPALWSSNFANNQVDPPFSLAEIEITPEWVTMLKNTAPAVPEPASIIVWGLLGALGINVACWRRRRSR